MKLFIIWAITSFIPSNPDHKTFAMEDWKPGVLFGDRLVVFKDQIYVHDTYDEKIKVYHIGEGLDSPVFLWNTPGPGAGPGEIPKGAMVNNLTINPTTSRLWVSHRYGFTIYDPDGIHVKNMKMPFNQSWLSIDGEQICTTSFNTLKHRTLLTYGQIGKRAPHWELPMPHGIPLSKKGRFLKASPELYRDQNHFIYYNAAIGELALVTETGNLEMLIHVEQALPESLSLDGYNEKFRYGKDPMSVSHLPFGYSGVVRQKGVITLLSLAFCSSIVTKEGVAEIPPQDGKPGAVKRITEIDAETGQVLGHYYHPVSREWIYLLQQKSNGNFLFFDMGTGTHLYSVSRSALQRIEKLNF